MSKRLLCLTMLLMLAVPASWVLEAGAQEAGVSVADRAAVQAVIQSQLAAFQRNDGAAAFSYAAPAIQQKFGDAESFMTMVRSGYAAVHRPQEVEMREIRAAGDALLQEVLFVGPDGQPVLAVYRMERQADGSWRIAGVVLIAAPDSIA